MNDNAISRAITHTHFAIVSAITFFLIVITFLYLTFSSGLAINKLKLGDVYAEQLYIKWDNTLSVRIGTLSLPPSAQGRDGDLETWHSRFTKLLKHADDSWIGSIDIDHLTRGDLTASVHFDPRAQSVLTLHSAQLDATCTLTPIGAERAFLIETEVHSADFNATLYVEGLLRLENAELFLSADANVSNAVFLAAGVHADGEAIHFNAYSVKAFEHIAPLVLPLRLDPSVRQWIVERAQGGPLMLHTLRTTIPYRSPAKALEHLYARLTFDHARYAFANDPDAFEPAIAKQVTVTFENKTLNIVPTDATFYAQSGGSTWLNIDFNPKDPVLNLYLNTTAALTPPLQRLTKSYGIDLPFVQTEGTTEANLTLNVNLSTNKTDAVGHFHIRNGAVDFSGLPMDINTTDFSLEGANVTIHSLFASLFEGNVTASVDGDFNPVSEHGILRFDILKAQYGDDKNGIRLSALSTPLHFDYLIDPKQDRLMFDGAQWRLGDHNISTAPFNSPFNYGKLTVTLPKTRLAFDKRIDADLSGTITLSRPSADLDLDLLRLNVGTLHNAQPHTHFHIRSDGNFSIRTDTVTHWEADQARVTVGPISLERRQDKLQLSPVDLSIAHQLSATIEGTLEPATMSSELNVSDFHFEDKTLGNLFESRKRFGVYVIPIENEYDIIVPSFNMLYSTMNQGWKLHFFSMDAFKEASPLLYEYNLTQSSFTAWSEHGGYPIAFKGAIDYPYALTRYENKPVTVYAFDGHIDSNESAAFTINGKTDVRIDDSIRIRSDGVDYDLPELTRFYLEHHFENDGNTSATHRPIYIDANDSAIVFSDGRKAKAKRIALQYENDHVYAQLYKGKGGAMLEVKGERFYLFGKGLDDDFMEHFFKLSKFSGGNLDFYVIGDKHDFSGLVKIDNTTIYDYVLLNNLFAFINTVPALVTFSLPSYESKGIKIKSAYAELKFHDGNLTISGIKVDSKEMDFAGQGRIDYNANTMQMELSVKTQAGDNIRKIPLVGYILVGDDQSVLTTVNISGSLEDPKISNTIAKDIIIAPFNLLKRAFNFPVHYLEKLESIPSKKAPQDKTKKQITSGTPSFN